jgi:serine/threonine-protein kinase
MVEREERLKVGRYELYEELASGGMATVHIGKLRGPVGFSRVVAIKRLHQNFIRDREFVTMFVDEARLAARIRHPNVVPITDVVHTDTELFLVMDYVHGVSLSRLLSLAARRREFVPLPVAVSIAVGALHGLHAAHEAKDDDGQPLGIVHRDVSPQNIIIGADGVPRVLDFGVAKARGRMQNTAEGKVKGKLGYMSPEQIGGIDVGPQADIYAVGVILWEMLSGRRLHTGNTDVGLLAAVLRGVSTSPGQHRPDLPPALDALVMRALELELEQRPSSARELALALEDAAPVASATQIGRWVEEVAAQQLAATAEIVSRLDSQRRPLFSNAPGPLKEIIGPESFSSPATSFSPSSTGSVERTLVSTSEREPTQHPMGAGDARGRMRTLALGALAVGVLALAALQLRAPTPSPATTSDAEARAAPQAAAAPPPPATYVPALPPEPSADAASAATASAPTAAAAVARGAAARRGPPPRGPAPRAATAPPPPAPAAPPAAAPAAAPPAAKAADCDPPYTIDSRGVQKIKPQCL